MTNDMSSNQSGYGGNPQYGSPNMNVQMGQNNMGVNAGNQGMNAKIHF